TKQGRMTRTQPCRFSPLPLVPYAQRSTVIPPGGACDVAFKHPTAAVGDGRQAHGIPALTSPDAPRQRKHALAWHISLRQPRHGHRSGHPRTGAVFHLADATIHGIELIGDVTGGLFQLTYVDGI